MKKIFINPGELYTTEGGTIIVTNLYSKKFLKEIEKEEKTACDECFFKHSISSCQRYLCTSTERKDSTSVYFVELI